MPQSVRVEVPDAFAGRLLVERLGRLAPGAQVEGAHGDLWLAFEVEPRRLPGALDAVRRWLEETRIRAARVRLDEREWLIEA